MKTSGKQTANRPAASGMTEGAAWSSAERQGMRRAIRRWYAIHARDLPWRSDQNPYRVWLSEIMLQQTQVATVVGYFERFVRAFPNVAALAAADEQQVLRLWEGLGYYRRARQLHAAARQIVADHAGRFPSQVEQLRELPGIGRYTAGAIASIAFGGRAPILEANTIRLLARLLGERRAVAETAVQRRLWAAAEEILPSNEVGQFNQALMEIGSLVCTPKAPRCGECPLRRWCRTCQLGWQDQVPAPPAKMQFESTTEAAVVVRRGRQVLVRQCMVGERWAGLWDFPRFALPPDDSSTWPTVLAQRTRELTGSTVRIGEQLAILKHGVTRFRITLHCYQATTRSAKLDAKSTARWTSVTELSELPLSTTGRQIAKIVAGES